MKYLTLCICTYTVFVLHTSLARDLAIAGFAPHLVLAGLAIVALRTSGNDTLFFAAVWGFLADCLSEGRLGPGIIFYSLAALILRQAATGWKVKMPWAYAALVAPVCWGAIVGNQILRSFADGMATDFALAALRASGSAVYTAAIVAAATAAWRRIAGHNPEAINTGTLPVSNHWRMLTE
ncbi:MAG: hypothetical protein HY290_29140 [Planctomycetia bacterium]|nr:hypothetical protein [Planctomycetia bacterium]